MRKRCFFALVTLIALYSAPESDARENPAVFSQDVDYLVTNSIDHGDKYFAVDGQIKYIRTYVSGNGNVSVCVPAYKQHLSEDISVFEYSKDLRYIKTMKFKIEYGSFGGFTKDNDGNYYFFSIKDVEDNEKTVENMAVVKYGSLGNKLNTFRLAAGSINMKRPSPGRMEVSGNLVCVYFGGTQFIGADGINHQHSSGFFIDKDSFERVKISIPSVASHSMDQFILPIDGGFAFADHGDGDPTRAFVFGNLVNGRTGRKQAFNFKLGKEAYQITFARIGGLAQTSDGYIFAGAYEKNLVTSGKHNDSRNLFTVTVDDRMDKTGEPVWITNYADKTGENAVSPKIAALGNDRFLLMWELMGYGGYKTTYMAIIDKTGKRLTEDKEMPGVRLNVNDILRYNKIAQNVYWAVNGADGKIDIYSFNPDKPVKITARGGAPADGYGLSLEHFTAEKISASQTERFTVEVKLANVLINAVPGGQLGAVLADDNGNIVSVIGTSNFNSLGGVIYQGMITKSRQTNLIKINCSVPNSVKPGQYNLRIAFRPGGKEWDIVTYYGNLYSKDDIPNNIFKFTVNLPGTKTPAATESSAPALEPAAPDSHYELLWLDDFTIDKLSVPQGERFEADLIVKYLGDNTAVNIFNGQLGLALTDNKGNIAELIHTTTQLSLSHSRRVGITDRPVKCIIPKTVAPGKYQLRPAVKPSGREWRALTLSLAGVSNAFDVTVENGSVTFTPTPPAASVEVPHAKSAESEALRLVSISRAKPTVFHNEKFSVQYYLVNSGENPFNGDVGVVSVDDAGNIAAIIDYGSSEFKTQGRGTLTHCSISEPGKHRITIAVRPNGKGWSIAKPRDGAVFADITVERAAFAAEASESPAAAGKFSIIPNPAVRPVFGINFYWQGPAFTPSVLQIYNSSGKFVTGVRVARSSGASDRSRIGVWDLKGLDGKAVPAGRYTVRCALNRHSGDPMPVGIVVDVR